MISPSLLPDIFKGQVVVQGDTTTNPRSLAIRWDHTFGRRGRHKIVSWMAGRKLQSFKDLNHSEIYALEQMMNLFEEDIHGAIAAASEASLLDQAGRN